MTSLPCISMQVVREFLIAKGVCKTLERPPYALACSRFQISRHSPVRASTSMASFCLGTGLFLLISKPANFNANLDTSSGTTNQLSSTNAATKVPYLTGIGPSMSPKTTVLCTAPLQYSTLSPALVATARTAVLQLPSLVLLLKVSQEHR